MDVPVVAWEPVRAALEQACTVAAVSARRQLTSDLHQIFRRLRHYENEDQWMGALRDGVAQHANIFGIFRYKDGAVRLGAQQNLDAPRELEFAVRAASAFAAAVDSREPVVAMCTAGEVGEALRREQPSPRAHLFPLANGARVVAVLFAIEETTGAKEFDGNALELIAGMAAAVLERQANQSLHAQIGLPVKTEPLPNAPQSSGAKRVLPPWADLDTSQRNLHIKAQRFSRVAVAEMQLGRPEAARAGRAQDNFYMLFGAEIDKARELFRKQFMTIPSMVDYLHLELVNTAAQGNENKLGVDYPGQLV